MLLTVRLPSLVLCLLAATLAAAAAGAPLSLNEYLQQVRQANFGMRSAQAQMEATALRDTAADLVFTPQVFGQIVQQSDEKPPVSPLAGTKSEARSLSFGVQKLWEFGLQSQLSYSLSSISIDRDPLPPLAPGLPNPFAELGEDSRFKEGQTRLDLVQPLWKNWAGREYNISRDSLQAKLSMQKQGEQYKVRSMLAQAEFVYWQLALAQEAVRAQQESLVRFQKIRDWVSGRVKMSLADRADLLQAEAGLKGRRFELELSQRDRTMLQRNFNTLRGKAGDAVEADLAPISARLPTEPKAAAGAVKRLDIEIAKQQERVADLEVAQVQERFTPQLDLFGTVALNSRHEDSYGSAADGAFSTDKPTLIVGLKFTAPLDRDLIRRERDGLLKASEASRLERQNKEFSAQQEWDDLQRQLSDARTRQQLAGEIESAQRQKLDYEKERLERGRTTTYQILLFEQDYANAQLASIKAKADLLGITARIKTFGDAL